MKKLNTTNSAFEGKRGVNTDSQCIATKLNLKESHLSQVIFSGSAQVPIIRLPLASNCSVISSMSVSVKQSVPIRINNIKVAILGFTNEQVCDLDLSVLEEMMRKNHLNVSEINTIKMERERLKRQKRKKRHKQKLKTEFLDLENGVDYLLQVKEELELEKSQLLEEIEQIQAILSQEEINNYCI